MDCGHARKEKNPVFILPNSKFYGPKILLSVNIFSFGTIFFSFNMPNKRS